MAMKRILMEYVYSLAESEIEKKEALANKHFELFLLMNKWTRIKQDGKNISSFLQKNGYKKIAIYGMSYVGNTLINELKNTDIEIVCGIDKNYIKSQEQIEIVKSGKEFGEVDAVIVTAFTYIDEIETELSSYLNCPIISIKDILFEVDNME